MDDHFLFAQALASVVAEQPAWTVAGIAVTGPEALGIAKERQPDVIVLDFHLPGGTMRRSDPPIAADGGGNRPGRMRPRTGQAQPPAVPFNTCV